MHAPTFVNSHIGCFNVLGAFWDCSLYREGCRLQLIVHVVHMEVAGSCLVSVVAIGMCGMQVCLCIRGVLLTPFVGSLSPSCMPFPRVFTLSRYSFTFAGRVFQACDSTAWWFKPYVISGLCGRTGSLWSKSSSDSIQYNSAIWIRAWF